MDNYILAGVGTVKGYDSEGNLLFTSHTLTEQSATIGVTAEDIRGGLSNPLLGKYFHDSVFDAKLTDALFNMQYIALNVGGKFVQGGDVIAQEAVTISTPNTIKVSGTPVDFGGVGTIGWYTLQGQDDWRKITFTGQTATVSGLSNGAKVCVQYCVNNDAAKSFVIPSSIIPSEVHLVMDYPLFSAGTTDVSKGYQVGKLVVDVPRFLLSGSYELNMTSTGAATSNLSGSALATYTTTNCDDMGQYATVTQVINSASWADGLIAMAVDGADIQLKNNATHTLSVISLYSDGARGVVDNNKLTFSIVGGGSTIATVSQSGVITAKGVGNCTVSIVATDTASTPNPIECYASVTVS